MQNNQLLDLVNMKLEFRCLQAQKCASIPAIENITDCLTVIFLPVFSIICTGHSQGDFHTSERIDFHLFLPNMHPLYQVNWTAKYNLFNLGRLGFKRHITQYYIFQSLYSLLYINRHIRMYGAVVKRQR